jgi:hypothetical protein
MNSRLGGVPVVAVKTPSPVPVVARSSQYGISAAPNTAVGRQALTHSMLSVPSCRFPFEDAFPLECVCP